MTISLNPLPHRIFPLVIGMGVVMAAAGLHGQSGVAPSQTGMFFDDLRSRASTFRTPAVDESGARRSGVYDYSGGAYEPGDEERPLGYRRPVEEELIAGRSLGAPVYGTTSRTAGSYTGESGPYPTTTTYFAPTYITDPFLAGKRNIKLGPVNIGLGMNANVEYNDNVNQSRNNKLDDIIAGIILNMDANWQMTQNNRLSLSIGVGVDHYFDHPELAPNGDDFVLNVLPGSTIAFDVMVGDVVFVFYDRLSVRPVTQNEFSISQFDVFGSAQNDVGVGMNWAINSRVNLSLNFNRSDAWALEDIYSSFDRVIHSISGSLAWSPSGTYTVGVEGSFSWVDYDEEFNNDGTTASAGVFLILPITKNTVMKASVGYQRFEFDSPPQFSRTVSQSDIIMTQNQLDALNLLYGQLATLHDPAEIERKSAEYDKLRTQLEDLLAVQRLLKQRDDELELSRSYDNSDLSDYYYNVTIYNQINQRVSHQLSFGHESSLNTTSNFITADYISYGIGIIAWRGSYLAVSTYYEEAEESGGRLAEDTNQWGFDVVVTHRLTKAMTVGLGYHYGDTDSNVVLRDYVQQSFTVDLNYALTSKMNVGLGYRYWTSDAEDNNVDFDQNRVIMSMNYNF